MSWLWSSIKWKVKCVSTWYCLLRNYVTMINGQQNINSTVLFIFWKIQWYLTWEHLKKPFFHVTNVLIVTRKSAFGNFLKSESLFFCGFKKWKYLDIKCLKFEYSPYNLLCFLRAAFILSSSCQGSSHLSIKKKYYLWLSYFINTCRSIYLDPRSRRFVRVP
jgi:hypothetical protein